MARSLQSRAAALAELTLAFEVGDATPLLRFHSHAWKPAWSTAAGREVHASVVAHPTLELEMQGTGVVLYGARDPPLPHSAPAPASTSISSDSAAVIVRDDAGRLVTPAEAADGVLVAVHNSTFNRLEMTFDDAASAAYSVRGATIYTHLLTDASSIDRVPSTQVVFAENDRPNEDLGWVGDWRVGMMHDDGESKACEVGTD